LQQQQLLWLYRLNPINLGRVSCVVLNLGLEDATVGLHNSMLQQQLHLSRSALLSSLLLSIRIFSSNDICRPKNQGQQDFSGRRKIGCSAVVFFPNKMGS